MFYTIFGFITFWLWVLFMLVHLARGLRTSIDYVSWRQNVLGETSKWQYLKLIIEHLPKYVFWVQGGSYTSIGIHEWHGVDDWRIKQEEDDAN